MLNASLTAQAAGGETHVSFGTCEVTATPDADGSHNVVGALVYHFIFDHPYDHSGDCGQS
jgi:hypothetical protein